MIYIRVSTGAGSAVVESSSGISSFVDLGIGEYEVLFQEPIYKPYVPHVVMTYNRYSLDNLHTKNYVDFDENGVSLHFLDPNTGENIDQDFTMTLIHD